VPPPHNAIEKGYYIQLRKIQELPRVKSTFFAKFFPLSCRAIQIDAVFPGFFALEVDMTGGLFLAVRL
jgi:hypothetical protein